MHVRPILLLLLAVVGCSDGRADAPGTTSGTAVAVPAAGAPSRGVDSSLLARADERAAALPRLHSLLVARHGELYLERYYRGGGRERPTNVKSASKSVLAALVGIALAEGALTGVDQPIAPFFARYLAQQPDPRARAITVGHLLSMQAGLEPTSFGNYGAWVSSRDWVRYVLTRPFVDEPGGRMLYSTGSTHLLSAILTQATGMSTHAYAQSRLFEPLGVRLPRWTRDPQGIYFGGNEMSLTPRAMLRFGELYRNGGVHEGRRVLPAEWIRDSWTPRTRSPYNGHRYGYGWWSRPAGRYTAYFAWGYGGQFIFVVPELELTVVATSQADVQREGAHLRAVHALLDEAILPAAEQGG